MRQILLSFFMSLLMAGTYLQAQCPQGAISLISQAEVDNFLIQYPNCTELEHLTIGYFDQSDIHDLTPLRNIVVVDLLDIKKTALTNLEGLNNLTISTGSFELLHNNNLENLQGLDNFHTAANIFIYSNPKLESFEGMNSLTEIASTLNIYDNAALKSLTGLEGLTTIVGGDGTGDLWIEGNNVLENLEGLDNLSYIGGGVMIMNNPSLRDLEGLQNLEFIGNLLRINSNPTLTDIESLGNVTSINSNGGYVQFIDNPSLVSFTGLDNIQTVGDLFITGNHALSNLNGLESLTASYGSFTVLNNNSLSSLDGIDALSYVGLSVNISENDNLLNIQSINGLNRIGCSLRIDENNSLISLEGMGNLSNLGATDAYCPNFVISISSNPVLENIAALNNITNINEGTLLDFYLKNNPELQELTGIENIPTSKINSLQIQSSPTLSTCNLPNICNFLSNGGQNEISGNATGCSSSNEILELCKLSIDEISGAEEITLYPVPTQHILNVSPKNNEAIQQVSIYDLTGKLVFTIKGNQSKVDISHFANGVYLVSVKTSKGIHNQKIIKE